MAIVKKRCIRCRKELREDGTCQNPQCVRYTPESEPDNKPQQEAAANES
jgi:hypothetical protein